VIATDTERNALLVPMRTGRGLNDRMHHMERHRVNKGEQELVLWSLALSRAKRHAPCVVRLTRVAPGTRPLDDDNLRGALKNVRDAVAKWLGIDDGDSRVTYAYKQERGPWGVRIEVNEVTP